MYCRNCGQEIAQGSRFCTHCAYPVEGQPAPRKQKNRTLAGLAALFFGTLGIHNFYLGHRERAVTQLVMSTVGGVFSCGIATIVIQIWATVEGIRILGGNVDTDAFGVPFAD